MPQAIEGRLAGVLALLLAAAPSFAADVQVLGLFPGMAVLRIDGTQRTLRAGQTSPEGVRLVRADAQTAVLEVDGKQARYPLGTHISSRFSAPPAQPVANIWPTNGMYLAEGAIDRLPVRFMVDTGASWVAMNAAQARRLGIDFRYRGHEGRASTASGTARVYEVVLDSVRVGGIELHNVKGAVVDGKAPDTVLLGASFLSRVEMRREGDMLQLRKKY